MIATTCKRAIAIVLTLTVLIGTAPGARAAEPPAPPAAAPSAGEAGAQSDATAATPPRLSYTDGDVSFWRPGGDDWVPAQVNTPLAAGDQLYTGNRGHLEIQLDARGFVRGWGDSQIGIENHEPDFLQLKIAAGHVSLDLRALDPGRAIELDTPAAAFTIDRPGYFRVDVTPDRTSFITRRGGTATMTTVASGGGQSVAVATSEQVVLGADGAAGQRFVAPEPDVWDRWNYARTDALVDTVSARYAPEGISGIDDLDQHGTWRVVSEYGSVWVPDGVAADWAPYTTGRWIWDPRFGWSWVDVAPWGWAPYHYGRWVHLGAVWAWAPGPVVVRPVYAPALVAFFGAPGVHVAVGAPFVSWVALGWGEPCVPWWGRPGFVGRPWWGGWGGPRVVNNVVINRTTVVNVTNVNVYRNVSVRNAVVAVRPDRFGRGPVAEARIRQVDTHRLQPVRGPVDVRPDRASFAAAGGRGVRPPEAVLARPVVATRAPATRALPHEAAPRIVPAPRPGEPREAVARPPLGQSGPERPRPPRAPRFDTERRPEATVPPAARATEQTVAPHRDPERAGRPAVPQRAPETPTAPTPPRPRETPPRPRETTQPSAPQRQPQPPQVSAPQRPRETPPAAAPSRTTDSPRAATPAQPPVAQHPPAAPPARPAERPAQSAAPARAAERPAAPAPRTQAPRQPPRNLPGQPANRLYPGGRVERPAPRPPETRPLAHPRPSGERAGGSSHPASRTERDRR
ncbi:MAG TPA: DUF6600 domain-containing protein [Methylomirabilota bacterium]|jgi:hypothetical protein|nr:DUF6600 domain-containing protein [Methylomirabilota bacterium]